MRALACFSAGFVALGLPQLSWACPACAGRQTDTPMVFALVAAMIALPYAVAVVAFRVIRKVERTSPAPANPSSPEQLR
ncbi:MAG: hypothetical protein KA712_15460 [Myxococcales bacterium]|nr:hypothetical protein [Myxococcales bacterium]